jgi:hypothetical protein
MEYHAALKSEQRCADGVLDPVDTGRLMGGVLAERHLRSAQPDQRIRSQRRHVRLVPSDQCKRALEGLSRPGRLAEREIVEADLGEKRHPLAFSVRPLDDQRDSGMLARERGAEVSGQALSALLLVAVGTLFFGERLNAGEMTGVVMAACAVLLLGRLA